MIITTHSKVDQVQFSHSDVLFLVRPPVTALDGYGEDDVRARGVLIHVGGCKRSWKVYAQLSSLFM